MPGPLEDPDHRRRNAPTIPTTKLPAEGYTGFKPPPPDGLGADGTAWWDWAWTTPQAAAWDIGAVSMLRRRARLEDELRTIDQVDTLIDGMPQIQPDSKEFHLWLKRVEGLVRTLQRMAVGEVTIMREMRELDDRLGLNPKAAAMLRWRFVGKDEGPQQQLDLGEDDEVAQRRREREQRLAAAT